jgi:hypothetical protein
MTKSKIAISLPKDQIATGSVSGYIARVLAEQESGESLRELLRDLIEQHGEPAAKDIKWAERAVEERRGSRSKAIGAPASKTTCSTGR